jgi:hypothetical protein
MQATHPEQEYHAICCGLTVILFDFKIVKGRDCPQQLGKPDYEDKTRKTDGLLLYLTNTIHYSAIYAVLLCFCVLTALVAFKN